MVDMTPMLLRDSVLEQTGIAVSENDLVGIVPVAQFMVLNRLQEPVHSK